MKPNNWTYDDTENLDFFFEINDIDWIQEVFDDERKRIIIYPEYEQETNYVLTDVRKIVEDFMKPKGIVLEGCLTWLSNTGEKAYRVFIDTDGKVVLKELDLVFI
jgi:hypothetical protein